MEEQIEREAAGLTGDEDFGLDDLEIDEGLVSGARRKDGATSDSDESDTQLHRLALGQQPKRILAQRLHQTPE